MPRGPHRRRAPRACRGLCLPLAIALCLPAQAPRAATYVPGAVDPRAGEPDPATGPAAASAADAQAAEPLAGGGIRWEFAPWRYAGSVALDARSLQLGDGMRSRQTNLVGEIDFASHVWQPWFIQVRAGVGLLLSRDASSGTGVDSTGGRGTGLNGRFAVSVFPASRFPFELRAERSDSRTGGDSIGGDYRSQRLSLSQGWRPERGGDSVQLNVDHSRIVTQDGTADTLSTLQATAIHQQRDQSFEIAGSMSRNARSDSDQESRIDSITARHNYTPTAALRIDTLATQNVVHLRSAGSTFGTDVRQVSTLVTWRPEAGSWAHVPGSPAQVVATARWVQAGAGTDGADTSVVRAMNGTLGLTQDIGRFWRASGAVSMGRVESETGRPLDNATLNLSLSYTPAVLNVGEWQYAPTASVNGALSNSSPGGQRRFAGLQATHSLSRSVPLGDGHSLSFNVSQSAGTLAEWGSDTPMTRALAHAGSVFWQSFGDSASQTFAGLSLSDSRSWGASEGRFQMVNLQLTRRTQLSRTSSWSANITTQATRNEASDIDPFTGLLRLQAPGWQHFHTGTVSYENQRVFGVPRLRLTVLLSANSQQLDRRAAGDIDAPIERISESFESRLDYTVGRLDLRLSARQARVEGRPVSSVFVRAQRRF